MKRTVKSESGRSMVEMLGVLAIIGVLSIGGIAGYTMAMNRYRANEVIDMANKFASLAFAGNQTLLARTGAGYKTVDKTSTTAGTVDIPSVYQFGLVTGTTSTGNALPGGGALQVCPTQGITADTVHVNMTFPTKGVCEAGANILGRTVADCKSAGSSAYKIEAHPFRQS